MSIHYILKSRAIRLLWSLCYSIFTTAFIQKSLEVDDPEQSVWYVMINSCFDSSKHMTAGGRGYDDDDDDEEERSVLQVVVE